MARQKVYAHEEILAQDINNFINSMETIFFKSFIGNALPNLPAFIGTSFLCEINGSDMTIKKGIAFMEKDPAPTDGSTPIALIQLTADKTVTISDLGISLPAAGSTKQVSVGVKWKLTDKPTEQRTYTTGTGNVDRATVTMNEWDSQFNYLTGTDASIGFVKIAEITLDSNGIQSISDSRSYFNMFDPDLFTLFGRKNLSFNHVYETNVNLIELPFEFTSAVPKIDQISVRKKEDGDYRIGTAATHRIRGITLARPTTATVSFNRNVNLGTRIHVNAIRTKARPDDGYNIESTYMDERAGLSANSLRFQLDSRGLKKFQLYNGAGYAVEASKTRDVTAARTLFGSSFYLSLSNISAFSNSVSVLRNNFAINGSNSIVFRISGFSIDTSARGRNLLNFSSSNLAPIHKGSNFNVGTGDRPYYAMILSSTNPISGTESNNLYDATNGLTVITGWNISFLDLTYNTVTRLLTLKLQSSASSFPENAFSRIRILKGTQNRFSTDYVNLGSVLIGNQGTFTITLSSSQGSTLFASSDSSFNNYALEFDAGLGTVRLTKELTLLTKNVSYRLLEISNKVYLDILSGANLVSNDELLISHIIPPTLLDQSSGTVLSSDLETEVSTLKAQVRTLLQNQATNTSKIATLEAQRQVDTMTTLLWGYGAVQAQASDNANNANSEANTAFATPANRNSQSANNLAEGAIVSYAAPAATGFYHPWLAIEISKLDTLRIENDVADETDLWSRATASITVNNKAYVLYARSVPLAQTETLKVVVQSYD